MRRARLQVPHFGRLTGVIWTGPKEDLEESGWKMVSGDVFRSPSGAVLLCVQVGSGVQIISSATLTLFFAALGELLPDVAVRCICTGRAGFEASCASWRVFLGRPTLGGGLLGLPRIDPTCWSCPLGAGSPCNA